MTNQDLNLIGAILLDSAIEVHKVLGPGLLESAYETALIQELRLRGLNVVKQIPVELSYKGKDLGKCYELDLLIENEVIAELKSVLEMHPVYKFQLITHLRLLNKKLGFLINFNVPLLKDGFYRIVNNF